MNKYVPPIVTSVPPDDGPPSGLTTVTVGEAGRRQSIFQPLDPQTKATALDERAVSPW